MPSTIRAWDFSPCPPHIIFPPIRRKSQGPPYHKVHGTNLFGWSINKKRTRLFTMSWWYVRHCSCIGTGRLIEALLTDPSRYFFINCSMLSVVSLVPVRRAQSGRTWRIQCNQHPSRCLMVDMGSPRRLPLVRRRPSKPSTETARFSASSKLSTESRLDHARSEAKHVFRYGCISACVEVSEAYRLRPNHQAQLSQSNLYRLVPWLKISGD